MKTKQKEKQSKRGFVVQIITAHGDYISAEDAWVELVDKRATTLLDGKDLQQTASAAVSEGMLSKRRGLNSKGNMRTLYGPPGVKTTVGLREATVYPDGKIIAGEIVEDKPTRITDVLWPVNPGVDDIPLGQLLGYLGHDMEDIMSVIRDAVLDRPLNKLRTEYPGLEEVIKQVAGVE